MLQHLLKRYGTKLQLVASRSNCKMKHAAMVLDGAYEPICWGYNFTRQGFERDDYEVCHAEVNAIHKWLKAFKPRGRSGHYIFVVRVNSQGEFMYSEPCEACSQMIRKVGLTAIWS